jgi:hypothetical protein
VLTGPNIYPDWSFPAGTEPRLDHDRFLLHAFQSFTSLPGVLHCTLWAANSVTKQTSNKLILFCYGRLCGPVVRVPAYRSRGRGSIPGAIRFSEK